MHKQMPYCNINDDQWSVHLVTWRCRMVPLCPRAVSTDHLAANTLNIMLTFDMYTASELSSRAATSVPTRRPRSLN